MSSTFYPNPAEPSDHKLLSLRLPAGEPAAVADAPLVERLRIRSVYIKEPSLVIERAYTPLYDTMPGTVSRAAAEARSRGTLELLVKRYADGELGRYLFRLGGSSGVEVRGPVATWDVRRDSGGVLPDEIVLVVGGTGITPAYQLLTSVLGSPDTTARGEVPRFSVLYAVRSLESALLVEELGALAAGNPGRLSVALFAERGVGGWGGWGRVARWVGGTRRDGTVAGMPVYASRITGAHLGALAPRAASQLVLVCGPDDMVAALAGAKAADGRGQGALGGTLGALGYTRAQVFKL
jgi:NAD(P)H-flavin reductase